MTYIALLRGVNVGGNNRVVMADLRLCFEAAGFSEVRTYINSGNVIFESPLADKKKLVRLCEASIKKQFGFRVICSVITATELRTALEQAPAWWGKAPDHSHNAIFAITPSTAQQVSQAIGPIKPEYERVKVVEPIIFWSAARTTVGRTRYSKVMGTAAYQQITIRNANTTKKLLELVS